jgi:DUF1365 family protein
MNSRIYTGTIRHRRFTPVDNRFEYTTVMFYFDLDELPALLDPLLLWSMRRPAPAWFRREDYHGDPAMPLKSAVLDTVESQLNIRPDGAVRILTQPRLFGSCFNPVSFYYCFAAEGGLQAVMAEITNTPWGERHTYCLPWQDPQARRQSFAFDKAFHVSPFMPMDVQYDWRFQRPGRALNIFMANHRCGDRIFDATLQLRARRVSPARLNAAVLRYPLMTAKTVGGIYYQALKLKVKGAPSYDHPKHEEPLHGEPVHGHTQPSTH